MTESNASTKRRRGDNGATMSFNSPSAGLAPAAIGIPSSPANGNGNNAPLSPLATGLTNSTTVTILVGPHGKVTSFDVSLDLFSPYLIYCKKSEDNGTKYTISDVDPKAFKNLIRFLQKGFLQYGNGSFQYMPASIPPITLINMWLLGKTFKFAKFQNAAMKLLNAVFDRDDIDEKTMVDWATNLYSKLEAGSHLRLALRDYFMLRTDWSFVANHVHVFNKALLVDMASFAREQPQAWRVENYFEEE